MKNPAAVALGRLGGAAGKGEAKRRTAEQCRKAALRRWANWREENEAKMSDRN